LTTLLVASTGGHLKQLHRLHCHLRGIAGPFHWVTFDTPQARSLLAEEAVDYVPFVGGRDPLNVARNLPQARRILREREVATVVSTGSAVALPFFALARAERRACHYIESAARIEGPSLTGKLMTAIPGVHRYAQYRAWANGRWEYGGSVFDAFEPVAPREADEVWIRHAVVTLGSYKGFGFRRLVERLVEILPAEAGVLWQTGETDVGDLPIEGHFAIPEEELSDAMREADLVVAHAGVGAALAACEVGRCPVLVPRRHARGEHIDDHQTQIATELSARGIAVSVEAGELSLEHLLTAATKRVGTRSPAPVFATAA
jgi:UDP-N-acetylglucosamine--N-acetylmuramyl-(pentapeptide) pyrophosphoryl-undecaprenol N-acetylglucosamine transferase